MTLISPTMHAVIDYFTAVLLVVAAYTFPFSDDVAKLTFYLGCSQFGLALITKNPGGLLKIISFKLHGNLEFLVGVLLFCATKILRQGDVNETDLRFYSYFSIFMLVIWYFTPFARYGMRKINNSGKNNFANKHKAPVPISQMVNHSPRS